jgi:hypothetical protein
MPYSFMVHCILILDPAGQWHNSETATSSMASLPVAWLLLLLHGWLYSEDACAAS